MNTKIFIAGLICLFLISCTTTGPKKMYTTDLSTGDVIVPAKYVGGIDTLKKKTKGNLIITNSNTKFVSEMGIEHFYFPTSSISGVYVGDEVKRHFGKTLARWLLIGPFALFFKDKSEVIAIEFTEKEKNIVVNPIFQIKVGTGPMLKKNIQAKSGFAAWEQAQKADTIQAYQQFIAQNPQSQYIEQANAKISEYEARKVKPDTVETLKQEKGESTAKTKVLKEDARAQEPPPLHKAASAGDKKLVARLLTEGADVNAKDSKGKTPLHWAAGAYHNEVAELLLTKGADVNATDNNAATPLHWAAIQSNTEVVELLLANGANVNASDADTVPLRVGGGSFILAPIGKGHTPLHWVGSGGNRKVAELLLANGANVNARSLTQGRPPLHFAVIMGNTAVAELLLAKDAEINAESNDGETPLHVAASIGKSAHRALAKLLIANGADVNAKNAKGETPLAIAETKGHVDIAKLLKKHGAKK